MSEIELNLNLAMDSVSKAKCSIREMETRINTLRLLLTECCDSLCALCSSPLKATDCRGCKWREVLDGDS